MQLACLVAAHVGTVHSDPESHRPRGGGARAGEAEVELPLTSRSRHSWPEMASDESISHRSAWVETRGWDSRAEEGSIITCMRDCVREIASRLKSLVLFHGSLHVARTTRRLETRDSVGCAEIPMPRTIVGVGY